MRGILFVFTFLFTTLIVKGQQCFENFTTTPTSGSCLSNASLTVKLPDGCTGDFAVELIEPNQVGLPSAPLLDASGSYTFTNLKAGTYTVTVINQATSVRSTPKTIQVTSTYKNIDITVPQITAPSAIGNDARVRFNIRPTGGIGPFKVSLVQADGTPLNIPPQQISKATGNVLVTFQGTNSNPISTGNVIIVIEDLANGQVDCGEIRKEPIQIPVPDPSSKFTIFKNGDLSRIRTGTDCKHQFWIRINRKDGTQMTSANVQLFRQPGTAVVRNLTTGVEYDISHTFSDGNIDEGSSFYTGYDFSVGDKVDIIIHGPDNTIQERFVLTPEMMNPMFKQPGDPTVYTAVYLYNISNRACAPGEWNMAVGEYWMWRQFTNEVDALAPARYARYEWHQPTRYSWLTEAQRAAGEIGYYYEVYRATSNSGPWTKLTHGTHYRQDNANNIILLPSVTSQGNAFFKAVYKNNSTGATAPNTCYEAEAVRWMQPINENYLERAYEGLEMGAGIFENTVSLRLYLSPTRFVYPAKMKIMPADGRTSVTFNTSLPLDGTNTYERTIKFPIEEFIPDPSVEVPKISFAVKGDFPEGEYDISFEDGCGRTISKRISLRHPARYDGDFVKIEQGCQYASVSYDLKVKYASTALPYLTVGVQRKNASGWSNIQGQSASRNQVGSFYNLPPGQYRLYVTNITYSMLERMKWLGSGQYQVPNETISYHSDGFSVMEPWDKHLRGTAEWQRGLGRFITNYHEFTIPETNPLQTEVSATYCERTTGNGLVIASVKNSESIRYPLTFRLKNSAGAIVNTHTYEQASGATSHIFTNVADGDYVVETEHKCGKWYNNITVKASNYANPTARNVPGVFDPCLGGEATLIFNGSEQLFDIEWFILDDNGAPIEPSIGTGRSVVQSVSATTTFIAKYQIKSLAGVCPGTTLNGTATTTVRFIPDTTAPTIIGCPATSIEVNASVGECSAIVNWGTVTATDNCSWTHTQTHQSGQRFDIGTHTVTYVFRDVIGNTSTCTFNVIVKSNALDLNVNATYIDGTGNNLTQDLVLNQQFQYKIEYKNIGEENITTSTLTIRFSDNPYISIGEPALTGASVGTYVPTYTKVGRTYTFILPKETLRGNSESRAIFIPLTVIGDYSEIGKACMNHFVTSYSIEYEGGNENCKIAKQTKTATNTISISTENNQRSELFCAGSSLELTATEGFDSYKWYRDGVLITSAVSSRYTATEAGVYTVEKITNCDGIELVNKETINFQEYNASTTDPIRIQANGGTICGADGRWTSHFILCNETSRTIKVSFVNTQLEWQRYNGTSTNSRCPDYGGDWQRDANGVGNEFVATTQGKYRLKATSSNGCEAYYYFDVYLNTLAGEIVQPVGHITDYQPGNFTVRMMTEGIPYLYTLRNAAGQIVNGINRATGTHDYRIAGISEPGTYTIEVTSPNLSNCSAIFTAKIEKRTELTAVATPKAWVDCNVLNINFEVQGGKAPYEFAIWKIDGVQKYPDYASIPASAFNIATIPVGQSFVDNQVTITQPGEYIFVAKDANGAYVETPKVDIYPEGVDGYVIKTKDIVCGFAENSGQVSVTFNSSLQNITTELHRLDSSGNRIETFTPNATGFYDGLKAGKYELEISIKKGGLKICKYLNPIEILQNENTLKAFAGVVEDESCDNINTPRKYKVHVNNVSGGSGTGYVYSSNGVDYDASNILYLGSSGKVYVKDSNGCPLEIEVNINPLVPPVVSVSNVEYTCSGKGTFTVTATPSGQYEYEVVGNSVSERKNTNVFTLPEGNYTVYVHYKPESLTGTTPNYLFREDFGQGDDTCDGAITYMTCKPNQELENGQYVITKQVRGKTEWINPTPTDASSVAEGRYLAVNANSNQGNLGIIYTKLISNVVLGTDLKVNVKLHNLLSPTYSGGKNPNVDLVLLDPVSKVEIQRIGLGQILASGNWEQKSVVFGAGFITTNELIFEIQNKTEVSTHAGSDLAVDDIVIWQETKLCNVRLESQSISIQGNKEFRVVGTAEDAKCDNLGKLDVIIHNSNGSGVEYSSDNVTWTPLSITVLSASEASATINNLPAVTNGSIYIRKQTDHSCVSEIAYTINAPETMSVTTTLLRGVSCDAPTAEVKVTAEGGTKPYQSFKIGTLTLPSVNNEATFSGVPAGTHEVQVIDTNGCIATSTLVIEDKLPLTLEIENLEHCFAGGETGRIQVNVTSGNGSYRFSKDATNFYASPFTNGAYYIFEDLPSGTHTFTVIDALNCKQEISATIYEPLRLNVQRVDNLTCATGSKAKFTLTATGGDVSKAKEFLWSTDNVNFVSANQAGITLTTTGNTATFETELEDTYYFRVRYDYGQADYCVATSLKQEVKVRKPILKAPITHTNINCGGTASGEIQILVTDIQGGDAPYEVLLFNGTATTTHSLEILSGLVAGTYVVTVKDASGCLSEAQEVIIAEIEALTVSITHTPVKCNARSGMDMGIATLVLQNGGTAPFRVEVNYKDVIHGAPLHNQGGYANGATISVPNLTPHVYTYVITDANGCVTTDEFTIEGTSDRIIASVDGITSGCATGSITVSAYNAGGQTIAEGTHWFAVYTLGLTPPTGTPPATGTTWVNGGTTWYRGTSATVNDASGNPVSGVRVTIPDLVPGATYKFIVYDHTTKCYIIEEAGEVPPAQSTLVVSNLQPTSTTCLSANDGKVQFTLAGWNPSTTNIDYEVYTYSDNRATTFTGSRPVTTPMNVEIPNLPANKYYVVFTENGTGCKVASEPFIITKSLTELVIEDVKTSNDNCHGGRGQISVKVKDGKAPYKYYYHNSATGAAPTGTALEAAFNNSTDGATKDVSAGTWEIFVKDDSGCVKSQGGINVARDNAPVIGSVTVENPCEEDTNFAIRLNLTQVGTGQHSYRVVGLSTWSDISIATGITSFALPIRLAAGSTYTVELKDGNGCTTSGTVTINNPMSYEVTSMPMECGTNNVRIVLSKLEGGSGNYEYTIDKVTAISDENGNTSEYIVPVVTSATAVSGSTYTVTAMQGAGTYRVRVYDLANRKCYKSKTIEIDEPIQPTLEVVSVTQPVCFGGVGSVRVKVSPNTESPYNFRIIASNGTSVSIPPTSSGSDYAVFDNLASSATGIVYTIEVEAKNKCKATVTATITSPSGLVLQPDALTVTDYRCRGNALTLPVLTFDLSKVEGGTKPYSKVEFYEAGVATPITTKVIASTTTSTYTYELLQPLTTSKSYYVKVYDTNGCEVQTSPNVTISATLILSSVTATTNTRITCLTNTENVSVEVKAATAYSGENITYTVMKRDRNGNETVEGTPVTVPSLTTTFDLGVGNYTIIAKNNLTGCEVRTSYDVHSPETFMLAATNPQHVKCHGGSDGAITLTFTDTRLSDGDQATAGFSYTIAPIAPSTGSTITDVVGGKIATVTGLLAGKYQVEAISQSTGCKAVTSFEIVQNEAPITATATETFGVTCSNNRGEVLVTIQGGKSPYQVTLTSADGSVNQVKTGGDVTTNSGQVLFIGLKSDPTTMTLAYNISVTDASGCVVTSATTIALAHPTPITATASITQEITCPGANDGIITISNVMGGSGSGTYNYVLKGTATSVTQSSTQFTNLPPDTYTVIVTDAWDCDKEVGTFVIKDAIPLEIRKTGGELTVCYAEKTAWINVEIKGGTAPYKAEVIRTDAVVGVYSQTVDAADPNFRIPAILGVGEYEIRVTDAKGCALSPVYKFNVREIPDLTSRATQEGICESNVYKTWIEVKFRTDMDFSKLSYQLGTGAKRAFSRHTNNTGYIDENVFDGLVGSQTMVIYYNDVDIETTMPVQCSYTLIDPITIEKTFQLGEVQVVPNTTINTIQVEGKDGVAPYTYIFNGENQGDNGIYKLRITDPEEIIDGRRYKVINVTVLDSAGCSSTKIIKEEYFDIKIPNFFTPDGDGRNDTWKPEYIEDYPYIRIHIYDRYGRRLKTLTKDDAWDGMYNNKAVPTGDYWYIIELNSNIDSRKFHGNFTLYR